jgi:hypothetical protein
MSDIDYCVSAFGSNKNGKDDYTTTRRRREKGKKGGRAAAADDHRRSGVAVRTAVDATTMPSARDARDDGDREDNRKSSSRRCTTTRPATSSGDGNDGSEINDGYTSGRYGVGLTLCLLHAQRLVPGTGACVTSATAKCSTWVRATYEPDADGDVIVCRRKERFAKMHGESGTTISLMVPVSGDVLFTGSLLPLNRVLFVLFV